MSGIHQLPHGMAIGGGQLIEAGDSTLAGPKAIADVTEF